MLNHTTDGKIDIAAWDDVAKDLGLTRVFDPGWSELVIFNKQHLTRGFLWIKPTELLGSRDLTGDQPERLTPGGALALLGHLSH